MPPSLQVMVPGTRQQQAPQYHATYPAFIVRRGADVGKIEVSSSVIPSHPNMQAAPRKGLGADPVNTVNSSGERTDVGPVEKIFGVDARFLQGGGARFSIAPTTLGMALIGASIGAALGRGGGVVRVVLSGLAGAVGGAVAAVGVRAAGQKDY